MRPKVCSEVLPHDPKGSDMRKYWLLDQHGGDGPTALVETDGALHIIDILRFGPGITALEQQQELWDRLIGRVAPTMKPLVDAGSLEVESEPPNPDLRRGEGSGARSRPRGGQGKSGRSDAGANRGKSGQRTGARGQR
ncbi:MAG: hypothetical protein OEU32_09605 [Acidimicrobiia bacterium]|nr:hypothetical protein [Acidimicrobiia bacterium]